MNLLLVIVSMSQLTWLQKTYWRNFSKPAGERLIYRSLLEKKYTSVLEIGIGDGSRTGRVLELLKTAHQFSSDEPLRYAGVDLFEGSPRGRDHMKLIEAHRLLNNYGIKPNLFPGDVVSTLSRVSHNVRPCQLILVAEGWTDGTEAKQELAKWIPPLLEEGGTILANSQGKFSLVEVNRDLQNQKTAA